MEMTNGTKGGGHYPLSPSMLAWGRLGGLDGAGGLGRGLMYCVEKKWWDSWCDYVAWTWAGHKPKRRKTLQRPGYMSNENLLEVDSEIVIRGTLGSYEMMKKGLRVFGLLLADVMFFMFAAPFYCTTMQPVSIYNSQYYYYDYHH